MTPTEAIIGRSDTVTGHPLFDEDEVFTILQRLDSAGYKIVRKDDIEQMLERVKRINS